MARSAATTFRELDVVRVASLKTPTREVTGSRGASRHPIIGDIGTIVHALGPAHFIVECVDADGHTVWLADFELDELDLRAPAVP